MPTKDENASPHNDPILFLNQEPESNTPSSTTREAGRTAHCFVLCILLPTHPREEEGSIIIQTKVCWAEPKTVLEKQAGNHSGSRGGDDICLKQKPSGTKEKARGSLPTAGQQPRVISTAKADTNWQKRQQTLHLSHLQVPSASRTGHQQDATFIVCTQEENWWLWVINSQEAPEIPLLTELPHVLLQFGKEQKLQKHL